MVYILYEKKYRKLVERLGISVSEEELKKMELMATKLKYRTKTWLD